MPRKAVFISQGLSLGLIVAVEHRKVLLDGSPKRVQRIPLHVRHEQGLIQHAVKAPQLTFAYALQLYAV